MGEAGTVRRKGPLRDLPYRQQPPKLQRWLGEVEVTIRAPEDFLVESDSRGALLRRREFPVTRNNRFRDRQELNLPITVAGYVQRGGRPAGCVTYAIGSSFSADGGEVIDLQMSGRGRGRSTGDIDIRLFRERDNRPGRFRFADASLSRTPNERIVIQRPGRYVLRVDAFREAHPTGCRLVSLINRRIAFRPPPRCAQSWQTATAQRLARVMLKHRVGRLLQGSG